MNRAQDTTAPERTTDSTVRAARVLLTGSVPPNKAVLAWLVLSTASPTAPRGTRRPPRPRPARPRARGDVWWERWVVGGSSHP